MSRWFCLTVLLTVVGTAESASAAVNGRYQLNLPSIPGVPAAVWTFSESAKGDLTGSMSQRIPAVTTFTGDLTGRRIFPGVYIVDVDYSTDPEVPGFALFGRAVLFGNEASIRGLAINYINGVSVIQPVSGTRLSN